MVDTSDIVIAGGGLVGSALAHAIALDGHDVTVMDAIAARYPIHKSFDGRAYALTFGSTRMLEAIGIWNRVKEKAQPILEIKVSQGHSGHGPTSSPLHFDHAEIEEGPMGYVIEDRHLRLAFREASGETGSIDFINDEIVAQQANEKCMTLGLASGRRATCKLLVGCDGKKSGTATRAGIKRTGWDYRQTALVASIEHDLPHHGIAHQFFMPPGPLAILPLPGNTSSIVWSENQATGERFTALSDADFIEVLKPRFGDFLGDIRLKGKRFSYPLSLLIANRIVSDRVALAGDAAHNIHPLAGQGMNLGLRDAATLAEVLSRAKRRGEDISSSAVLARYQQCRSFENVRMAMATDIINKLFSNDVFPLTIILDIGMGMVGRMPMLRREIIREAAGLGGDLPYLMR